MTWPAALILSRYLALCHARSPGCFAGLDVLELGSGTGIVALALAVIEPSARIVATDIDDLRPLIEGNIALNGLEPHVRALELPWSVLSDRQSRLIEGRGPAIPSDAGKPHLILAGELRV